MKRRTAKKRYLLQSAYYKSRVLRERDKHDRAYLLAFMRAAIATLAAEGDVDTKVLAVATLARRLAPAIGVERARGSPVRGQKGPDSDG